VNDPSADELVANSQECGSSTCKDARRPIALRCWSAPTRWSS